MTRTSHGIDQRLAAYIERVGVREHPELALLREETAALAERDMQIAPDQGAFMAMLVELMGARRCVEVGTFTGYSALAVALALPADGRLWCFDVSEAWTSIARRHWQAAGVADRIELSLDGGIAGLERLLEQGAAGTMDFGFVDADKTGYPRYHELMVELLRPGGVVAYDNVFWGGDVADPSIQGDPSLAAVRALNERIAADERVTMVMLPIGDGLTLARKR
jgi:predicted O-methyltransferase YrrM